MDWSKAVYKFGHWFFFLTLSGFVFMAMLSRLELAFNIPATDFEFAVTFIFLLDMLLLGMRKLWENWGIKTRS